MARSDELSDEVITTSVEDAVRLNVAAVAVSIYVGSPHQKQTLQNLSDVVNEAMRYAMPVLAVTAVGKDMVRAARYLGLSCRIAAELGAAMVKTYYCDGFDEVVRGCPVPIVMAGGKKLPEKDALTLTYQAMQGGAKGVDMGRNIFLFSVHTKFTRRQIDEVRTADPAVRVLVHPECPFEVVQAADLAGSTEYIIRQVSGAPAGTSWAIGTEINLVHRLALEHPGQRIHSLQKNVCPCATMNRIDPAHLLWTLENLAGGHVVNPVRVPEAVKAHARVAIGRMLALRGDGAIARAAMARD